MLEFRGLVGSGSALSEFIPPSLFSSPFFLLLLPFDWQPIQPDFLLGFALLWICSSSLPRSKAASLLLLLLLAVLPVLQPLQADFEEDLPLTSGTRRALLARIRFGSAVVSLLSSSSLVGLQRLLLLTLARAGGNSFAACHGGMPNFCRSCVLAANLRGALHA